MAVARLLPGPRQFTCARGKLLGKHAASWMERRREQRHLLGLVAGIQLLNLATILRSFSAKIVSFFFFRFLFFAFCFEEEIKDRRIAIKRANKTVSCVRNVRRKEILSSCSFTQRSMYRVSRNWSYNRLWAECDSTRRNESRRRDNIFSLEPSIFSRKFILEFN